MNNSLAIIVILVALGGVSQTRRKEPGQAEPVDIGEVIIPGDTYESHLCLPGTKKHDQMKNVRLALSVKYGSYFNLPKYIREGYKYLYGSCVGFNNF